MNGLKFYLIISEWGGYFEVSRKALHLQSSSVCLLQRVPLFLTALWCLSSAGERRSQSSAICPQPEPNEFMGWPFAPQWKGPIIGGLPISRTDAAVEEIRAAAMFYNQSWRWVGPWSGRTQIVLNIFRSTFHKCNLKQSFSVRSDKLIKILWDLYFICSHEGNLLLLYLCICFFK